MSELRSGSNVQNQFPLSGSEVAPLLTQLLSIRDEMLSLELQASELLNNTHEVHRLSARNLLHYVAIRRRDIRELQEQLVVCGLSSLGRCEAYVMANLESVISILRTAMPTEVKLLPSESIPVDYKTGRAQLRKNTKLLLGDQSYAEPPIMVTMPAEAATDRSIIRDLVASGMRVMRINCAHDERSTWSAMIDNLRETESLVGKNCRIAMDLGGPKIRTGSIEADPSILSWKPSRDEFGRVTAPARVWFKAVASDETRNDCDATIHVTENWWRDIAIGQILRLRDAAGRKRRLNVVFIDQNGFIAESTKTTYVTPDTVVRFSYESENGWSDAEGRLGPFPAKPSKIVLHQGQQLLITDLSVLGKPARLDHNGDTSAASIGCTLADVFKDVQVGDRVLLDDGKITCVVREAGTSQLVVEVTRARESGSNLKADKGMNFPDTDLHLPALSQKDIEDLEFVAQHADIVSYSFVRKPEDIRLLRDELTRLGRKDLPIILKIETKLAFENLPLLLLEAMSCKAPFGVMIARGDLAVECGWERLVEVQEEILWMCEAAHAPVIWATQVLESLAQSGLPTRAEVTDAGMGSRAECVMLNKGANIVETVQKLHDILCRMNAHQVKKRPTFRRLQIAERLFPIVTSESISSKISAGP